MTLHYDSISASTLICINGLGADGRSPLGREQRIVLGGALLELVLVAVEIGAGDLEQENRDGDVGAPILDVRFSTLMQINAHHLKRKYVIRVAKHIYSGSVSDSAFETVSCAAATGATVDHPFQWGSKRNGPDLARDMGPVKKLAQT